MDDKLLLLLIPLLPLIGFLINGLARSKEPIPGIIASLMMLASFALSLKFLGAPAKTFTYFAWIPIEGMNIDFALRIDQLSQVMILIVTGVGLLIHIYSIGYMHEDPGFARFFAYLNLFCFAMLILVLAANLPLLFVGWEGVGLCSYLLIGFWYKELFRADAAKKAFIVNRIGDFGFLLGMFGIYVLLGTFDFASMKVDSKMSTALLVPCLLLFLGACGKSAQIPLFVWLPDAMAGPTPVSALIHAATMVTAGIYMLVRMSFVFEINPEVYQWVGTIAAATAFITGIMGMTQYNLKKVLAYSTVSQLSYMFCGVAVGAYQGAMFHLMTHAFFKALLFLGAGAVIHSLHNEEDMRKMGGLKKQLPFIHACFIVGGASLAGLPIFSGFFSKEAILGATFEKGWFVMGAVLLAAAIVTAFYTIRMIKMTFWGHGEHHEVHKPPATMNFALGILMLLSIGGGFLGFPLFTHLGNHFHVHFDGVMIAGTLSAIVGLAAGYAFYDKWEKKLAESPGLQNFHALPDKIYEYTIVLPMQMTAFVCWLIVDRLIIDTLLVNQSAMGLYKIAGRARSVHSGTVATGVAVLSAGALALLLFLIYG